jgi:hypothetical protein
MARLESDMRIACENAVDEFWSVDFHNSFTGKSHILGVCREQEK